MSHIRTHLSLALALILAWPSLAGAELLKPQADLYAFAIKNKIPCYMGKARNGIERVCLNVTEGSQIQAVQRYLKPGCNVLEICHFDPYYNKNGGTLMHTLSIFDRKGPHFQSPDNFRSWRVNDWMGGGDLYVGKNPIFSALIQLDEVEANNLRSNIKLGQKEQGGGGVMKTAFGGARGNCASLWSDAPLGKNGETLGRLCGIGSNGSPHGLQQALESSANEKVFGVIRYGGTRLENFGADGSTNLFGNYMRDRR